jgi:glutathionylspermidine amidase/synthetase
MSLSNIALTLGLFSLIILFGESDIEYDKEIGRVNGVILYSSYNKKTNLEKNYIKINNTNIFTGLKWQWVEFARRYLILKYNITFQEIDNAYQIFDLNNFNDITNNKLVKIKKCINGNYNIIKEGSLLIWNHNVDKTGHVAVITKVNKDSIDIAEQNKENKKWKNNYSRQIKFKYINNNIYILDEHIIGWILF